MCIEIKSEGGLRHPKLLLYHSNCPEFRRRGFFLSRTQGKLPEKTSLNDYSCGQVPEKPTPPKQPTHSPGSRTCKSI